MKFLFLALFLLCLKYCSSYVLERNEEENEHQLPALDDCFSFCNTIPRCTNYQSINGQCHFTITWLSTFQNGIVTYRIKRKRGRGRTGSGYRGTSAARTASVVEYNPNLRSTNSESQKSHATHIVAGGSSSSSTTNNSDGWNIFDKSFGIGTYLFIFFCFDIIIVICGVIYAKEKKKKKETEREKEEEQHESEKREEIIPLKRYPPPSEHRELAVKKLNSFLNYQHPIPPPLLTQEEVKTLPVFGFK